jgi:hypothetical protein
MVRNSFYWVTPDQPENPLEVSDVVQCTEYSIKPSTSPQILCILLREKRHLKLVTLTYLQYLAYSNSIMPAYATIQ